MKHDRTELFYSGVTSAAENSDDGDASIETGHDHQDSKDLSNDLDYAETENQRKANADTLRVDRSLAVCWSLAERHKSGYLVCSYLVKSAYSSEAKSWF